MNLSLKNSSQILNAKTFSSNLAFEIDNISIDSRSLQNNEKTLFFALVGPNNDAHFYIKELIAKNVRNFVVEKIPENLKGEANFLVVFTSNISWILQRSFSFSDYWHHRKQRKNNCERMAEFFVESRFQYR